MFPIFHIFLALAIGDGTVGCATSDRPTEASTQLKIKRILGFEEPRT